MLCKILIMPAFNKTILSLTTLALFVSSATWAKDETTQKTDFLLIGGGIMSASLGTWLQELQPEWKQVMVEKLDGVALESSNGWNLTIRQNELMAASM